MYKVLGSSEGAANVGGRVDNKHNTNSGLHVTWLKRGQDVAAELDPTEQRAWQAMMTLTTRLPSALDTCLQREFGVTHFEYRVLAQLSEEPDHRLRMTDLACAANASISRLSHVVSKLERTGLAHRSADASRRGVYVILTPDGYQKVAQATPEYLNTVRCLVFDALDPDQKGQLATLCEMLSNHLVGALNNAGAPLAGADLALAAAAAD
jgi:DNA-binding MarR family transcriptional regulator